MSVNIETACDSIRFTVDSGYLLFLFIEIIEKVFVALLNWANKKAIGHCYGNDTTNELPRA